MLSPHNAIEEIVAGIWAEVLGVQRVGIHEEFLELGGNSLLAIKMVSRINRKFQVDLPMSAFFKHPTVASLADVLQAAATKGRNQDVPALVRGPRSGTDFPLSFAQERLWFLDQLTESSTAYTITLCVRLAGPLNVVALEQSFNEIIRRHEILRTNIVTINGHAVQRIASERRLSLAIVDLPGIPESRRVAKSRSLAKAEARRRFDLQNDSLLRLKLLRFEKEDHTLLIQTHHIIFDGWSVRILFDELEILYQAFLEGRSSPLPELPCQYADYAVWLREWLQGDVLDRERDYWKNQLAGAPFLLKLPMDATRAASRTHRGKRITLQLSRDLSNSLKVLGQQHAASLFMVLLTAFQILLHRLCGQEEIVIGVPIANRRRFETEGVIGFFINNLVLRLQSRGNPTFLGFLERLRQVTLQSYEHQDFPFEKVVEQLDPERNLNLTPLFQVFVNAHAYFRESFRLCGLRSEVLSFPETESKFDMTLYIRDETDCVLLDLVYNADLFSASRIRELLNQYHLLLQQIVIEPTRPAGEYSLVTPEAKRILPDPTVPLPASEQPLVTSQFLSWAEEVPDHPAVKLGNRTWSYAALAQRASELTRKLWTMGLQKGDVVAATGPRSFGLIVGMVAAFQSGGVLMTLDPALPPKRRRLMLEQAGARYLLVVDGADVHDLLTVSSSPTLLTLGADNGKCGKLDLGVPSKPCIPQAARACDPAYIFFTSGSTGVPKAVVGVHRSLSHFLNWQRRTFQVGPSDRVAQLSGLSFDVVLRDVFLPLTSGATICLPEEAEGSVPGQILPWLGRAKVTLLHAVPSLAQSWLATCTETVDLESLRTVFFAGEPLAEGLVRLWRENHHFQGTIVNLYGPTETTLVKCYFEVPTPAKPGIQPVGYPLPNTQAMIMKKGRQMCGLGEIGEIVLRTPFRSLGYANAPQETAEHFVVNPFRQDEDDLLYLTGDQGRYLLDGSLEFLGRLDHQVKIRGVRVEPDEISAILLLHPAVQSSVVISIDRSPDSPVLVAYVVARARCEELKNELRRFLLLHLPTTLVPSRFEFLESMPLTPNGKVDRSALPLPDILDSRIGQPLEKPRNPIEKELAIIWADVLKASNFGIYDDFFELGGHSLLAMQAISRISETLKVNLPLRTLFESPRIADLANRILERFLKELDSSDLKESQGGMTHGIRTEQRTQRKRMV